MVRVTFLDVTGVALPPLLAGDQPFEVGFDILPARLEQHLGHPRLVHVGEVDERAESEADVLARVLPIPRAHQIADAHAATGEDRVKVHLVAFHRALADGRELHGADVSDATRQPSISRVGPTTSYR